jgi:MinD-like ATPase involved in chromosome partitioning or flagellar assembly
VPSGFGLPYWLADKYRPPGASSACDWAAEPGWHDGGPVPFDNRDHDSPPRVPARPKPGNEAGRPDGPLSTIARLADAAGVPALTGQRRRRELIGRVQAPVIESQYRIVVMSLKGGVGKTTVTVGLGSTLASLRPERVIAVDANPDRGTLGDKVALETAATVRDLLSERDQIRGYADMRAFTSQTPAGLEILTSDQDPAVSVAFGALDYAMVSQTLAGFYAICLTDCGTGLLHSAMAEVLRRADQIVLASTPAIDSARSADATLDWLAAHGHRDLARNAVLVLSATRPRSRSTVSLNLLQEHFAGRCRAVTRIPFDVRLDEGAEVELDRLGRKTADAFLGLAAVIAAGFRGPAGRAGPTGSATGAAPRQAWPRRRAGTW